MSERSERRRPQGARNYPRVARLNHLVHEIVAEELERIDDTRIELVTVIRVLVEPDMRRAIVFYDTLADDEDDVVTKALADHRVRLQAAIGRQTRIKRVPELSFRPDDTERTAARVEEILTRLRHEQPETEQSETDSDD